MKHGIILAPMEGLVDAPLRDILTRIGGIDRCVSEFIRVTEGPLNVGSIRRIVPESLHGWKTAAGVPVHPQLLGSDPDWLGHNAALLAELGAPAVDLNFGCPAKTVNRHRGGATLLREPDTLHRIVAAVRAAVPADIPVTAKMRLGYSDTSLTLECASALATAGAAEIAVHARTKVEGYKPPAHWEWLARVRESVSVAVIANGDVNDVADYQRIREISGCEQVMIGRGLVACPDLGQGIRAMHRSAPPVLMSWSDLRPWLIDFYRQVRLRTADRHAPGRLKQWLGFLARNYPEAQLLFDQVRRQTCADTLQTLLETGGREAA
ncbi:tRNA-dihydrouridine synthase family protein [Halopseudomonas sp. SMJS2]|uniref:tRNA dihydrouridine synthase n=1 Tax=Halopseudomonas sp. SMJS2 TaxID=3041098 RepID=UPI0004514FD4|nr:tRNA-dihydrouridine synthase family protein [Halopseudomonas sp. SMJS2]EZQ18400.1 tRNA-dihydrouridine synthase C [Halopseudomonas bauzanensis]WGK62783.1 tRNA-dihydrouridine synthase family protein [Halopseudomonas sp. SMJS2]